MNLKDCVEGEYYFINFYIHNAVYICKSNGGCSCGSYIDLNSKLSYKYGKDTTWRSDIPCTVRQATETEILWLDKCIRKCNYVEKPTILNFYGLGRK